jgi:hypothetical protein
MSFATNVTNLATRIATEVKALRTLINGNAADNSALTTTAKANLVAAINEVNAKPSGGASNLDALSDVAVTTPATGHVLRHDGSQFVNVLGTTFYEVAGAAAAAVDNTANLATASTTKAPSVTAAKNYIDAQVGGVVAAADAMVFKGVLDASASPNYPAASRGDTYRISVAGKVGGASGTNVEVGDLIICLTDGTASGTQAGVGASWTIVQTNIDGAVVGPASSTLDHLASFGGTTGKVIADKFSVDTDTALTANSTTALPSQSAVKGYTYSQTQIGDPATDFVATFVAGLA